MIDPITDPVGFRTWWNDQTPEGKRAYMWPQVLDYADLSNLNLSGADLRYSSLHMTCFRESDLRHALVNLESLQHAELADAILSPDVLSELMHKRVGISSMSPYELMMACNPDLIPRTEWDPDGIITSRSWYTKGGKLQDPVMPRSFRCEECNGKLAEQPRHNYSCTACENKVIITGAGYETYISGKLGSYSRRQDGHSVSPASSIQSLVDPDAAAEVMLDPETGNIKTLIYMHPQTSFSPSVTYKGRLAPYNLTCDNDGLVESAYIHRDSLSIELVAEISGLHPARAQANIRRLKKTLNALGEEAVGYTVRRDDPQRPLSAVPIQAAEDTYNAKRIVLASTVGTILGYGEQYKVKIKNFGPEWELDLVDRQGRLPEVKRILNHREGYSLLQSGSEVHLYSLGDRDQLLARMVRGKIKYSHHRPKMRAFRGRKSVLASNERILDLFHAHVDTDGKLHLREIMTSPLLYPTQVEPTPLKTSK
jgi:hypothetical protein